jgi:hypothetical protein
MLSAKSDARDEKIDCAKDVNRTLGKRNDPFPEQLARYAGDQRSIVRTSKRAIRSP